MPYRVAVEQLRQRPLDALVHVKESPLLHGDLVQRLLVGDRVEGLRSHVPATAACVRPVVFPLRVAAGRAAAAGGWGPR